MPEANEKLQQAKTGATLKARPVSFSELSPGLKDSPSHPDRETRQSLAYRVFVGPQGLRSGWSIFIFLAIVVALLVAVRLGIAPLHINKREALSPATVIVLEGSSLLVVVVATAMMAKIENRPVLSYGFSGERKLSRFLWGALIGVAVLSAFVTVLRFAGVLSIDGLQLHGLIAWEYGLGWAVNFLLVGLFEESLLRGYLQFTLARGVGFWWAALLLSAAFGLMHLDNQGESPVGLYSAAGIGLVFCLSLWLTKSLWWAVGMHAGWDWAQSYLFGVADSGMIAQGHLYASHPVGSLLLSGGPTGPEGSIFIVPLLLILGGGVWLGLKPRGADVSN